MTHPLIDRLTTEFGWPCFTDEAALADWLATPGTHVLFQPGDPKRNLETADVAVILPELRAAFQNRFDCAVADAVLQSHVKDLTGVFKTPSLIFWRDGEVIGAIPKVRDWSDYLARIGQILSTPVAAE